MDSRQLTGSPKFSLQALTKANLKRILGKRDSLEAAKAEIRQRLSVSRLPLGLQIWDLAERPLARWRVDAAS